VSRKIGRRGLFGLGAKVVVAVGLAKVLPALPAAPAAAPIQFSGFAVSMTPAQVDDFSRIAGEMMANAAAYQRDMDLLSLRDAAWPQIIRMNSEVA
jgi:hypothetical protein